MRKSRWVAIVCAGVILALILVLFLYRDTFLPGEKTVLKRQPESRGESVTKKIELPPPQEEAPRLPAVAAIDHDIVQERVEQYFQYLDGRKYIQAYTLKDGSYLHFVDIASKLSSRLPVASGETDDLSILRSNIAHLFRVMGKTDVSLTLDILSHEKKEIERTMEVLYEWGVREAQRKDGAIKADMGDLYEYAAFFLNTLSGKMYLLRRKSRVRILLTYYSILILDRANTEKLNSHGVDILPHVNLLIDDIERYRGLNYKDRYLERLKGIRGR